MQEAPAAGSLQGLEAGSSAQEDSAVHTGCFGLSAPPETPVSFYLLERSGVGLSCLIVADNVACCSSGQCRVLAGHLVAAWSDASGATDDLCLHKLVPS